MNEGQGVMGYLLKDTTFEMQVNKITQSLNDLTDEGINPIIDQLQASSQDIALTSRELRSQVEQISLEEGLIGTLLKDSLVVQDLKQTMYNLNEGTGRFSDNMEALKHNFFFRGYFKKQEKQKRKANKSATVKNGTS